MASRQQGVVQCATFAGDERAAGSPRRLLLDIVEEAGDWVRFGEIEQLALAVARAIEEHGAVDRWLPAQVCVALANDVMVRRLNRSYRATDKTTNVLSFPAMRHQDAGGVPRLLGDIVLADGVIAREAAEVGILPAHHIQHLIVHGLLHLMGYDHGTDAEAEAMERLEIEILATLGVSDPYRVHTER